MSDATKKALEFSMKPLSYEKMGEKLIRVTCYLFGLGINRNNSNITRAAAETANNNLAHIPVVGHLIQDENGEYYLGGHDYSIEVQPEIEFKPLTVPLGCVAGDTPFEFVELIEENTGKPREYLKCDLIIWNNLSPVMEAAHSGDVYFNESMEIDNVEGHWDDTNNFLITGFEYDRICLLGLDSDKNSVRHTEPCFIRSQVFPKQFSEGYDFNKLFALLIKEIQNFNDVKEGENLGGSNIPVPDVSAKIKLLMAETAFRNDTGKQYEKYIILSVDEPGRSITVVDRGDNYRAYSIPYMAAQTDEGLVVNIDYDGRKELKLGAGETIGAVFDVSAEVGLIVKDTVDYEVGVYSSNKINDLLGKLDGVTAEFAAAKAEIEQLNRQLAVFENEKKQYLAQKHKEVVDALVAAKREEMGKFSEFLDYCLTIDYGKTIDQVQDELKTIHYNFMVKNKPQGKKTFSAVSVNVIDGGSSGTAFAERYGEDMEKLIRNQEVI